MPVRAAWGLGALGFVLTALTALLTGFTVRGALLRGGTAALVFGAAGYLAASLAATWLRPRPGLPPPVAPDPGQELTGRRLDYTVPGTRPEELFQGQMAGSDPRRTARAVREMGFSHDE